MEDTADPTLTQGPMSALPQYVYCVDPEKMQGQGHLTLGPPKHTTLVQSRESTRQTRREGRPGPKGQHLDRSIWKVEEQTQRKRPRG